MIVSQPEVCDTIRFYTARVHLHQMNSHSTFDDNHLYVRCECHLKSKISATGARQPPVAEGAFPLQMKGDVLQDRGFESLSS